MLLVSAMAWISVKAGVVADRLHWALRDSDSASQGLVVETDVLQERLALSYTDSRRISMLGLLLSSSTTAIWVFAGATGARLQRGVVLVPWAWNVWNVLGSMT
jgi:hypothetical protein